MFSENKKWIITIIILVLLVLGLGGFIVYDKILKKEETRIIIDNKSVNITSFYDIEKEMALLDKTYNNPASSFYGDLYENRDVLAKEIEMPKIIYTAINGIVDNNAQNRVIKGSAVKNSIKRIFSKQVVYKPTAISVSKQLTISYDEKADTYTYTNNTTASTSDEGIKLYTTNTELKGSYALVKRKLFAYEYKKDESGTINKSVVIYKDKNKNTKIATLQLKDGELNEKEIIAKYGSRLSTYVYSFKEESQDNYRFYSIVKE